jgi:hypothetical protein
MEAGCCKTCINWCLNMARVITSLYWDINRNLNIHMNLF